MKAVHQLISYFHRAGKLTREQCKFLRANGFAPNGVLPLSAYKDFKVTNIEDVDIYSDEWFSHPDLTEQMLADAIERLRSQKSR